MDTEITKASYEQAYKRVLVDRVPTSSLQLSKSASETIGNLLCFTHTSSMTNHSNNKILQICLGCRRILRKLLRNPEQLLHINLLPLGLSEASKSAGVMEIMFQNRQASLRIAFLILLCSQLGSARKAKVDPSQGTGNPGGGSGRAGNQGSNAGGVSGVSGGFGIGIGIGNGSGNGNGNGNGGSGSGYGSGSGGLGLGIGIGFGVPATGVSGNPLYCVPTNCPNGGNCARFWAAFNALASNSTINNGILPENSAISTGQRG